MYFRRGLFIMKKFAIVLVISTLVSSCEYFRAKKISHETYLEEEVQNINWREIDSYPLLATCSELSQKQEQQACFAREVSRVVQQLIDQNLPATFESFRDTAYIQFFVSEKAEILISDIRIGNPTMQLLPNLEEVLMSCTDSLKLVAPAYKRGIPVKTQFTLPVVLRSNEL